MAMAAKIFDLTGKRVWVAGHRGMVGSAVVRALARRNIEALTTDRKTTDLRDPAAVARFVEASRPDVAVMAAAKVGGILANDTYPADFLYDNLMIEANAIHAAWRAGTRKLIFLGSSCIYPKFAPQPIAESSLLTGALEPTNEWYAVAKIAGIKLCQAYRRQHGCDFISAMPTNLYGPHDNFDPQASHVLAGLLRRIHEAKEGRTPEVAIWGTGKPLREFMHVNDLADAILFLLEHYSEASHINVGFGEDVEIRELAQTIASVVGYGGKFVYDTSKPDGTPRKLMDSSRLRALGWSPKISLRSGLQDTYLWFRENYSQTRLTAIPAK